MQCTCTVLPSVACHALQYLSTLSHKRYDFQKKSYCTQNVYFDFLYKFVWNISHSKTNWARYDHKCAQVFLYITRYSCPILMKSVFLDRVSEGIHTPNFKKIRPVGAELFHADRRTFTTKLVVAFRDLPKAHKNCWTFKLPQAANISL
jgi:hypothetical protein